MIRMGKSIRHKRVNFPRPASMSVGVLEMGGGSTQIAFLPEAPVYANMFPVRLGGETYVRTATCFTDRITSYLE